MRARQHDPRTALHYEYSVTMEPRLEFGDSLDVDERRPVNAHESEGVELRLEIRERVRVAKDSRRGVKAHFVVVRLDPRDIGRIDEQRPTIVLHDEPEHLAVRDLS